MILPYKEKKQVQLCSGVKVDLFCLYIQNEHSQCLYVSVDVRSQLVKETYWAAGWALLSLASFCCFLNTVLCPSALLSGWWCHQVAVAHTLDREVMPVTQTVLNCRWAGCNKEINQQHPLLLFVHFSVFFFVFFFLEERLKATWVLVNGFSPAEQLHCWYLPGTLQVTNRHLGIRLPRLCPLHLIKLRPFCVYEHESVQPFMCVYVTPH